MEFITIIYAIALGVLVNLVGKVLCEKYKGIPRLVWWFGILIPYGVAHFMLIDIPVFLRMVGLCVVLLLSMKVIIYMEWVRGGGKVLPWQRWFAFSYLWFGMQPKAWVGKRRKLEWQSHVKSAIIAMVIGAVGLSLYVLQEWRYFPLSFIFMSMMFHYGVLRLNTAVWRWAGFPVRTLFRNPLVTTGFQDFWGARWNLAYSQMMARAVQKPLIPQFGKRGAVFGVFIVSGFFHELAITVPAMDGYGLPFLFFLFHGIAVLIEKESAWMRYACLAALVLGLPILFPSGFIEEIILPVEEVWRGLLSVPFHEV